VGEIIERHAANQRHVGVAVQVRNDHTLDEPADTWCLAELNPLPNR
jgi:hypothetical protein